MNQVRLVGGGCTLLGILVYIAGVMDPFPGRELAVVMVLVGGTLFVVGGGGL